MVTEFFQSLSFMWALREGKFSILSIPAKIYFLPDDDFWNEGMDSFEIFFQEGVYSVENFVPNLFARWVYWTVRLD